MTIANTTYIPKSTTDPISSQTKTLLCEKLTELKQSNNISLQAVTYILSQYNISLTEAASLLNVPLLQLSTMSVAQIEGLVSSTCQEYGTAALSSGSASQSSNTTYIPNNQSYNSSRSTYNNTSGYSGHRGGQNRGSFSNDDRYDRENDYSDYWYDGTEYKYNHRVWRWVLLGVFCALCIAVAFALLCFACYRPYHSPTPTVVTPLPVTEKIYTTNGQIEVPPLPISPMPAYSNAATLRI
ncbi:unnamed protein product [Bursaphelenchus okinawaensis]|uniref:Uncharacterized protein n=1 Tax=Bursaphelenchus okinawaensis TaxID=465554 RepID=A0A811LAU7_9BILA|nr:unnamed protein product [Bursaphelenchus okinawaensis]CAG9119790.1 unnamed protein product [Bursaphelenchus okinawaensis]